MLAGADAKTSQISAGDYMAHFEQFLAAGQDVVHVTLSSGISGTFNSACAARDQLAEKYPDRHVYVVDSLAASSGYGLLMDKLAELRDAGMGAAELAAWAEEHKNEVQHWFFSSDLTFFIRGGRISKAAGLVGGMLKICPVMDVAPDGSLAVKEKIRTKAKAINRVVEKMEELAEGGLDYSGKCYISQSECKADALEVAARVEERFPKLDGKSASPSSTARSRSSPSAPPSACTPGPAPWPCSSGERSASSEKDGEPHASRRFPGARPHFSAFPGRPPALLGVSREAARTSRRFPGGRPHFSPRASSADRRSLDARTRAQNASGGPHSSRRPSKTARTSGPHS